MPQSSLHSLPFTDITLFRDGNNPSKPFRTALLSFATAYLGYDWYMHNHATSVFFPTMILYFSYAGRIKQRILCCRKFIIMFGSSDLFIEQLLALAECPLLKFSFRAWQKYCILSLLSLDRFSKGILINISSKKNAFVRVFTPTIRHFETGLFKKSGKIR